MKTIDVTHENFEEEVLHSQLPVLVDFYADWCGACRMLAPVMEEIVTLHGVFELGRMQLFPLAQACLKLRFLLVQARLQAPVLSGDFHQHFQKLHAAQLPKFLFCHYSSGNNAASISDRTNACGILPTGTSAHFVLILS